MFNRKITAENRADSENYLLCKKIKLYVPYGKSADSNPRHAVLEQWQENFITDFLVFFGVILHILVWYKSFYLYKITRTNIKQN